MVSSRNINYDRLDDLENVRYLSKEVFEIENNRTKAEKGDIFFTSVGTLGRSCCKFSDTSEPLARKNRASLTVI